MAWDPYLWQALMLLALVYYILIQGIYTNCLPHMGAWFQILNLCNPYSLGYVAITHAGLLFYRTVLRPVLGSVTFKSLLNKDKIFTEHVLNINTHTKFPYTTIQQIA
jgi:hypothetical protein